MRLLLPPPCVSVSSFTPWHTAVNSPIFYVFDVDLFSFYLLCNCRLIPKLTSSLTQQWQMITQTNGMQNTKHTLQRWKCKKTQVTNQMPPHLSMVALIHVVFIAIILKSCIILHSRSLFFSFFSRCLLFFLFFYYLNLFTKSPKKFLTSSLTWDHLRTTSVRLCLWQTALWFQSQSFKNK